MKKAIRSSAILAAASAAMVAGLLPAGAATPLKASAVIANASQLKGSVSALTVGGSTFVKNFAQAAMSAYNNYHPANNGVFTSAFGSVGSATGRSYVANGTYQIGFSDVPLSFATAAEGTGFAQVPDAVSGVAIIYNLGFTDSWTSNAGDYTSNAGKWSYTPGTGTNGTTLPNGGVTGTLQTAAVTNTKPVGATTGTVGSACRTLVAKYGIQLTGPELGALWAGNSGTGINANWNDASIIATNPKLVVKVSIPVTGAYTKAGHTTAQNTTKDQVNGTATVSCLQDLTKKAVTRYSRKDGSGTTFMFRDYLHKVDASDFGSPTQDGFNDGITHVNVNGTSDATVGLLNYPGAGGSGDLATAVEGTDGGLTYDEYGYATAAVAAGSNVGQANSIVGTALIQSGDATKYVAISDQSIAKAAALGLTAINNNIGCGAFSVAPAATTACFSITNVAQPTAYPISGFTYALLPTDSAANLQTGSLAGFTASTATQKLEALKFILWFTQTYQNNSADTAGTGFIAMPKAVQSLVVNTLCGVDATGKITGSGAFGSLCLANN